MRRLAQRIANEPAAVVAAVLAALNFIGVDSEQLRTAVVESVALLLAGGLIRQSVYSPQTHRAEVINVASHPGASSDPHRCP